MFGLLRRRAKPALSAPLLAADWDGRVLNLTFDAAVRDEIALDVDGCYFTSAQPDGEGLVRIELPYLPSGATSAAVLVRRGRDGSALCGTSLQLTLGKPGLAVPKGPASPPSLSPPVAQSLVPFGADVASHDVAVVVPVYNAAALVERCLAAVLAHTDSHTRLIVIDDASTDAQIEPLLAQQRDPRVRVLRNETNRGFTATANRGIAEAGRADVVLLNADTEVGPNWLVGLRRAAYASDDIATATAVSDNAGAFSVPELERENTLPACWTFEQSARAVWQQAGLAYPELPTGNGFCLYIRRNVIDAVGVLDEAAFAQGYGEENDFCQRASQRGLRHVIAGNVLVRHARSASFGDERRAALGLAGMAVLRERWPNYEADVARMLHSFERRVLDWRVRRLFAGACAGDAPKLRVLWVGENAPAWPDAEVWCLRANRARNEFVCAGRLVAANEWQAHDPEPSYRALWQWLQQYAIEVLVVTQRKDSVAEILCGLLGIPIALVAEPFAATAAEALQAAESNLHPSTGSA